MQQNVSGNSCWQIRVSSRNTVCLILESKKTCLAFDHPIYGKRQLVFHVSVCASLCSGWHHWNGWLSPHTCSAFKYNGFMGSSCLLMEGIVHPTQGKRDFKSKQIKCTQTAFSTTKELKLLNLLPTSNMIVLFQILMQHVASCARTVIIVKADYSLWHNFPSYTHPNIFHFHKT